MIMIESRNIIKILPHHATKLFEAFYLKRDVDKLWGHYNNEKMRQNDAKTVNAILSNPDQLVRVVDSYDQICSMCPKNKQGNNYIGDVEDTCDLYDTPNPDTGFIEVLNLQEFVDGKPVTSKNLFEAMKLTYEKLVCEIQNKSTNDNDGPKKTLSELFLKPEDIYTLSL